MRISELYFLITLTNSYMEGSYFSSFLFLEFGGAETKLQRDFLYTGFLLKVNKTYFSIIKPNIVR